MELYRRVYENWAGAIRIDDLWACAPRDADEVVTLTRWARDRGWTVRPSGHMHNWSPLTVTLDDPAARQVVLAETTAHLTGMRLDEGWAVPAVRVGSGVSLDQLLPFLENHGYGFTATTAPGNVTIGGVLAIDGHGAAIPAAGEDRLPGGTYGSLSNLVLEVTAVVWDGRDYSLRTFRRDDRAIEPLLAHLGRAFVVEAVLQVAPDVNLRCESFTDVPAAELFADPSVAGERSFAAYLERAGRAEAIWFPFTDSPWLKVWSVRPEKPAPSRETDQPYNYPFSDNIPPELTTFARDMVTAHPESAPVFGRMMHEAVVVGLAATRSADLWGPSKNTLLYIRPTTMRVTANGYAVLCRRRDIQQVVADFCAKYLELVAAYRARDEYPMNMPVEIRVTGLDRTEDVDLPGAVEPAISALRPRPDRPDWDVAVWLDVLSLPGTPGADRWYTEMEAWLLERFGDAVRPEWSKGWGYTPTAPWTDLTIAHRGHRQLAATAVALDRLDPHRVFSNPFLDRLLTPSAAPAGTDLRAIGAAYLAAIEAGDAVALPLAENAWRYRNGQVTARGADEVRASIASSGVAAITHRLMAVEGSEIVVVSDRRLDLAGALLAIDRLRVEDGLVTEIESVEWSAPPGQPAPARPYLPARHPAGPCASGTRACNVEVAAAYLEAIVSHDASGVALAPDAWRIENGMTNGSSGAEIASLLESPSMYVIQSMGPIRWIVEADQVVALYELATGPTGGTPALIAERFRIQDGLIKEIEALFWPVLTGAADARPS